MNVASHHSVESITLFTSVNVITLCHVLTDFVEQTHTEPLQKGIIYVQLRRILHYYNTMYQGWVPNACKPCSYGAVSAANTPTTVPACSGGGVVEGSQPSCLLRFM